MSKATALVAVVSGCWWGLCAGLALGAGEDQVATAKPAPAEKLYRESLRPQFHFTARYWDDYRLNPQPLQEGWLNDVNGLVYFDGEYHLFGQRWWACWLHAVSKDLIHWQELPPAFGQDEQFGGTQSGSCVIDVENTSGLATGNTPVMVAFWSAGDNQRQCISYSNDRGRTWTKYAKNPVLAHPHRDPKVFWYAPGKHWVMVLYGPPQDQYLLFSSPNLLAWEPRGSIPEMFECPDMFPLALDGDPRQTRWVVVAGNGEYLVGQFDGQQFRPEPKKKRGDFGPHFYATQTWNNMPPTDPRRIQVAWMRGGSYPNMPFNQQWTFPCELSLHDGPQGPTLHRYPIAEIERLWDQTVTVGPLTLEPASENPLEKLAGQHFDVQVELDIARSNAQEVVFGLLGKQIRYRVGEKLLDACDGSDPGCQAMAPLEPVTGRVRLRFLVDCTSIEAFGNQGAVSLSQCILPDLEQPPLRIVAVGGKVQVDQITVHTMKSMWE